MRISKPWRALLQGALSGVVLLGVWAAMVRWVGRWAFLVVILFPIAMLFCGILIDEIDLYLRRRSRDPLWLMSAEGEAWLATDEGRSWAAGQEREGGSRR